MVEDFSMSAGGDAVGPTTQDAESLSWHGSLFCIESVGRTLVIVPMLRRGMFRYATLQTEANALRRRIDELPRESSIIVDLHELDYLGSEAIGASSRWPVRRKTPEFAPSCVVPLPRSRKL